jgi:hypothetical protein
MKPYYSTILRKGIICAALLTGCTPKNQLNLNFAKYEKVTTSEGIALKNITEIGAVLAGLPSQEKLIWNKPDKVLFLFQKNSSEPEMLSLFLSEGFVYQGYFIDAWTERMEGHKSRVYILSKEKEKKLSDLLK